MSPESARTAHKPARTAHKPARQVAVVTGAASGIGRAAAMRLARDGWAVAIVDVNVEGARDTAESIAGTGGSALGLHADVTQEEEVDRAIARAEAELGPIGALVGSAGILTVASAMDLPAKDWRRVLDVNLTGAFLPARSAARRMIAQGSGGRIVQVASVHSVVPGRDVAHYDASKGGVWMLVRALALELAPHRIRVNAVGPGLVRTNLTGPPDPAYLGRVVPTIPLGRIGEPEDVAGPIAFLCGPEADYITGSMLFIDGGMLLTAQT